MLEHFAMTEMTHEAVPDVSGISKACGLSHWSEEDYRNEIDRKDSIAICASDRQNVVGFIVGRVIGQMDVLHNCEAEI
jgi:hypothetical protein